MKKWTTLLIIMLVVLGGLMFHRCTLQSKIITLQEDISWQNDTNFALHQEIDRLKKDIDFLIKDNKREQTLLQQETSIENLLKLVDELRQYAPGEIMIPGGTI